VPATAIGVSDRRDKQPLAIEDADYFYDPAVSGANPIETRPGFSALPNRIGVRTVIVEDTSRFARALVTQELGFIALLKKLGVRVLTASGNDLTVTDDPMKKAVRQIAGVFAELERPPRA
jgi:DNA invertase Pin-like site-specific DNA recombinase